MASLVTHKGYHAGREPANKGRSFPVEVLTDDEVKALKKQFDKWNTQFLLHVNMALIPLSDAEWKDADAEFDAYNKAFTKRKIQR